MPGKRGRPKPKVTLTGAGQDARERWARRPTSAQALALRSRIILACKNGDPNRPPPWVGQLIHRRLRELTGVADPYQEAKGRFNRLAVSMLPELRARVRRDPNPLIATAKAAIAANIIDLGVKSALDESQAEKAMRESCSADAHGDFVEFQRQVDEAREILYLADNAGEIAIDRLLIEELGPER